jgi:hypothetical protein
MHLIKAIKAYSYSLPLLFISSERFYALTKTLQAQNNIVVCVTLVITQGTLRGPLAGGPGESVETALTGAARYNEIVAAKFASARV